MSPTEPVRILDLGFGKGAHWLGGAPWEKLTVVDASDDWLQEGAEQAQPAKTLVGELPQILNQFKDDSFHIVLAFDVIEHLPKHDGYLLAYEMQRIASDLAVIYTPNGMVWQPGSPDNPFNAHISGWTPTEFKELGWRPIRGHVGPKPFWGPYMTWRGPNIKGMFHVNAFLLHLLNRLPKTCFAISAEWRP